MLNLLFCCSLIRLKVYQTLSRQVLSAFSSNLVRGFADYKTSKKVSISQIFLPKKPQDS